ncbi:sensor histidine kinase [Lacibacter sediminis]|uniref:Histidine kinase n=1 Tax=Lacibacter sediminis TaxID=2760713 RepID=A0A7G5XLB2_9BACT|nr:histidine kinase [Lacibacter sediminis]QNA46265.1 histidine kinase [Lacibacter sediminis]
MRKVLFLTMPVNRMHYILRCCFVFLFICLTGFLHAQELRYQLKNYTPSDGLPSSETYQVLRDASNYMWFATDHGVTRYNGYEFETFNLPDNSIMGLYEDWKKRVWVFTFSGRLFYYENGKFENYKWNDKLVTAIKPGVIQAMYVDSNEVVHVSSSGPYYVKIRENGTLKREIELSPVAKFEAIESQNSDFFVRVIAYPEKLQSLDYIKSEAKSEFNITSKGRKIVLKIPRLIQHERCRLKRLSDGRLILYTKDSYTIIRSANDYDYVKTTYTVDDIEEIDGNIFQATEHGLYIINKQGLVAEKYLEGIHITSIERDYEGGVWVTTLSNGVFYLNHFRIRHLAYEGVIINKRINILYRLSDASILAGVHGNEVIRFKPSSFFKSTRLELKDVVAFHEMSSSLVLVGGPVGWYNSKLWTITKPDAKDSVTYLQIPNNSNFAIKDSVLYSGLATSVYEYKIGDFKEPLNFYSLKEVFRAAKIFLENDGGVLVGNQFGLWRYRSGYVTAYDSTKKILSSRITDIAYYQNKFLCLSTRGNGVLLKVNDSIYQVTHSDGLVSDNIRKIYVDQNNIWLASNNGVSIVTISSLQPFRYAVRNITVQDGLLSNEINSIIKDGKNVVIASNNGISFLNLGAVMSKEVSGLPLYVKSVKVNNALVAVGELTKLGYRKRNLNISYEALNYGAAGKNNYRYRLLGYDTNWIYTNNREIQFNPLPYGSYKLEIQVKREYDGWNSSVSFIQLSVLCKPPFWATTWFWVAAFSLLMFLVILLFRKRINDIRLRQKQQEDLKQKINDTEQMALKAQMNPHFIFNSLNSIQQYVIDSDVKGANEFISGFSKLIRQTLEFSSKEIITLEEEISYLSTYLDLEKARMESGFTYNVNVQTQQPASQLELPPLLLQPYVENALRHGVRYLKHIDGVISLTFIEYPGLLECIIEDNGIGREKAMELKAVNPIEYQSRGMSLTAERIALLNEGQQRKIEVVIEDLKDQKGNASGTRIRVLFPA